MNWFSLRLDECKTFKGINVSNEICAEVICVEFIYANLTLVLISEEVQSYISKFCKKDLKKFFSGVENQV